MTKSTGKLILGIESSCDETAAAVVRDGKILSNKIYSQVKEHEPFGGVVPEIAARQHVAYLPKMVNMALEDANISLQDIDALAVTRGPGLLGSLLVGTMFSRGLMLGLDIPLIGINHLEAHLLSPLIENDIAFPFLGLIVSGGHTELHLVKGFRDYECLAYCIDDAAGEAFDKVGKLFGLPYPAGRQIDEHAKKGNPSAFMFPRPMSKPGQSNFSFSGIKTAAVHFKKKTKINNENIHDVFASFQEAVVDSLIQKVVLAVQKTGVLCVAISGGVACNSRLREKLSQKLKFLNGKMYSVRPMLATDNAAMIAYLGEKYLNAGLVDTDFFDVLSNWPIESSVRPLNSQ